jgi:PhzF family phenazine biosynthesis protein
MKLPLYQLDAFTSHLFGGNPAAVVVLDEWLPDRMLSAIAAENNLAETAFAIPRPDISPRERGQGVSPGKAGMSKF